MTETLLVSRHSRWEEFRGQIADQTRSFS